jgi:hypothetical protein
MLESWRLVWRSGFAPILPIDGLKALATALLTDDKRLVQGSTTTPPPLMCVQDWPVEAGDCFGYISAVTHGGFGVATVGECEEFFAKCCYEADQALGEPAACRWFLNWYDDTPRDTMRRELLEEVELIINGRKGTLSQPVENPPEKT